MIELKGVTRLFGTKRAVDRLDLTVQPGEALPCHLYFTGQEHLNPPVLRCRMPDCESGSRSRSSRALSSVRSGPSCLSASGSKRSRGWSFEET
jgi:hypothetical protein